MNPLIAIDFILLSAADSSSLTWFDKYMYGFRTWIENWFVRFSTNSWQIRVSYYLLWISILITIILLGKFIVRILWKRRKERKYDAFRKEHEENIRKVLEMEELLTDKEIEEELKLTIENFKEDVDDKDVKEYYEKELKKEEKKRKAKIKEYEDLTEEEQDKYKKALIKSKALSLDCPEAVVKVTKKEVEEYYKDELKKEEEKWKAEIKEYEDLTKEEQDKYREKLIERIAKEKKARYLNKNIECYATLIADLKWKYDDKAFIPNMQLLCKALHVTSFYEEELITGSNILTVLQEVITLPLPLEHEGVLACYINHYDKDVRNLARMCYIISTADAPYQYLQQVLDENKAQWNTMLLHKIFEWMNAQDREMPDFLVLAKQTTNEDSAAFLIQEIAKLGTVEEQKALWQFLEHDSLIIRRAAFVALTELMQKSSDDATRLEDFVLENYDRQTEDLKRSSLVLLQTINTGRALDRFEQTFHESSCIDTKVCAITCLLGYDGFVGVGKVNGMLESITNKKSTANSLQKKYLEADEKIINQVVGMYIINNNKLGV